MDEEIQIKVVIEQLQDRDFRISFDTGGLGRISFEDLEQVEGGAPGGGYMALAAAIGNCIGTGLIHCLGQAHASPSGLKAVVTGRIGRTGTGPPRLRGLDVQLSADSWMTGPHRVDECLRFFGEYCKVAETVRHGIPVQVQVYDQEGKRIIGAVDKKTFVAPLERIPA